MTGSAVFPAPPDHARERARLSELAGGFSSETGFNALLIDYRFEAMAPWLAGARRCLELGCADGRMTARLRRAAEHLTAVDGSASYVETVRARFPEVEAVQALFEEFDSAEPYDVVVLGHVLEHVADPVLVLRRARRLLAPGGRALVSVPNARSLHRQAGCVLGLLREPTDLNEADLRIGHRRVYTREALVADVRAAGLEPEVVTGVFLKPLSNAQIEATWDRELMDAFYELGKRYPELCAELLVVAVEERPC
ncbi:MAG TPA: methyltransferase domain-containing protein [Gaiellaceae bacterium]|nr:methyltransferase domain-containing protein [Gaiellaceae bacterium]